MTQLGNESSVHRPREHHQSDRDRSMAVEMFSAGLCGRNAGRFDSFAFKDIVKRMKDVLFEQDVC